ncbi:hypothetical protein LTR70_005938 [Exophiala xenobiotica]|uniref:Uncharacterized protein n=1 Tax=Lithohypha guttulata TaxID=1690604 RepID=A0ABR0K6R4_9EURO|nr:hypothetical protein LTR24_006200 [Lithohypha guttulata]KAK5317198.1 hypothetical protein LTR70_005938 [Exophiala xenobiotica]
MVQCIIIPEPDRLWEFCPSLGAAVAFLIIFATTSIAHTIQAIIHRNVFAVVLIMGGLWETTGFILRVLSIINPRNGGFYSNQGILILLAPLWINAFVYMALGRLVHFSLIQNTVLRIKARHLTLIFVVFDITAFLMQATGGILAAGSESSQTKKTGYTIYTAGVGIQMGFIGISIVMAARFHHKLLNPFTYNPCDEAHQSLSGVKRMLYSLYAALALILYRNSFRLAEYATGADSSLRMQEWWFFAFDAASMSAAMVLLNIFHPGHVLRGPRKDFSEETKTLKRARKQEKLTKKIGIMRGEECILGDS